MKYPNYLFEYIEDNKRLRAELAATQAAWLVEVNKVARVRELCELAIRDPDSGVGIEDIVNAIEGNGP